MTRFISILRGINVSGQKKIKMADLKVLFQGLGLANVTTYIQSGNVIFDAEGEAQQLKGLIEQQISKVYDFDVPVLVFTQAELAKMANEMPFIEVDLQQDATKVLFTFIAETASSEQCEHLLGYVKAPEQLVVADRVVYIHCPNGYGKSKLSNVFVESKLKRVATTRNWKTVLKLLELSQQD